LSLPLPGASANDLLNSQNNRMKSIALERHFLLTFCCCRQKVSHSEGILCEKSHGWQCSPEHKIGVATNKKNEPKLVSSNPKESLKHFQKHILYLLNHWSLSKAAKLRAP